MLGILRELDQSSEKPETRKGEEVEATQHILLNENICIVIGDQNVIIEI